MLIKIPTLLLTGALSLTICNSDAFSEEEEALTLAVKGGLEYESNITVDAQDLSSGIGDGAALLEGEINYKFIQQEDLTIDVGYDFYQSLHLNEGQFDLQINSLAFNVASQYQGVDVGATYRYSHTSLGGDSFLEMHIFRPNAGYLVSEKLYLSAAYEYQKRNFKILKSRDANQHGISAKTFFFIDKGEFISTGYQLIKHDTKGDEFTYWGHFIDLGYKTPIKIENREGVFRASYSFKYKKFSNITPSIDEKRSDKLHSLRTSLELPIFEQFTGKAQYEYIASNSNLAAVDYDEHIFTLNIAWKL